MSDEDKKTKNDEKSTNHIDSFIFGAVHFGHTHLESNETLFSHNFCFRLTHTKLVNLFKFGCWANRIYCKLFVFIKHL